MADEDRSEDVLIRQAALSASCRFDLWQRLLSIKNPRRVVEIGVWRGEFAAHLLESCASIERYYLVDPWAKLADWNKPFNVSASTFDEIYSEAIKRTAFASKKVVALRGKTQDVLDEIPSGSIDFAYVDGDHTLRGIANDLIRLLPKMAPNAWIGGDDFVRFAWQHGEEFEPTLVFPFAVYFAEAIEAPITALPLNQFLIEPMADLGFSFNDLTGSYMDTSVRAAVLSRTDVEQASELGLMRQLKKLTSRILRLDR